MLQSLFYLTTALHISAVTITIFRSRELQHLVTRCCSYSCFVLLKMVIVKPETCRAVVR